MLDHFCQNSTLDDEPDCSSRCSSVSQVFIAESSLEAKYVVRIKNQMTYSHCLDSQEIHFIEVMLPYFDSSLNILLMPSSTDITRFKQSCHLY